jgi:hypothetical protein
MHDNKKECEKHSISNKNHVLFYLIDWRFDVFWIIMIMDVSNNDDTTIEDSNDFSSNFWLKTTTASVSI